MAERTYKFSDKEFGGQFWEDQIAEVVERPAKEAQQKKDMEAALEKYKLEQIEAEKRRQENKGLGAMFSGTSAANSADDAPAPAGCCVIS